MAIISGNLRMHILEASLDRDTEWFGKMDPWCQLKTKTQTFRTRSIKAGSTTPKWDQAFTLRVENIEDMVTITVFDDENNGSHDLVSYFIYSLFLSISSNHTTYFLLGWI